MTRWPLIALCTILTAAIAGDALAKRSGPKPVAPVVSREVKYVAPNESGREGRIEARSAKTGEKLWDAVIYTVAIYPKLEEDVQWVFITGLEIVDDALRVTNEKNEVYTLDLKTKKVTKNMKGG